MTQMMGDSRTKVFSLQWNKSQWQLSSKHSWREIGALNEKYKLIYPVDNEVGDVISITFTCRSERQQREYFIEGLLKYLNGESSQTPE